ncbi:MAG TPA: hypothetical protein VHS57_05930 [Acidimicrobiales bacterium]|nr:hypothetical protein [Acidimicrobiales bacterium]
MITVALGASVLTLTGLSTGGPAAGDVTALPSGWELCILQETNAPLTPENVADLDGWQVQEGGSTNNTAAYNPFNTGRTTDAGGNPLPTVGSSGFPAFANWLAGCAATTATLLQPNMATIVAALRAGNVSPSAAFLALVDQSQWCAPSADGVPCYASAILGSAASLPGGVLSGESALDVYGNVKSDLHSYQLASLAVANDKSGVAAKSQQAGAATSEAKSLRTRFNASQRALKNFAVDEYMSSGLYTSSSITNPAPSDRPFGPQTANGVVAQQYESVAATAVLARSEKAAEALRAAIARRNAAAKSLQQVVSLLSTDTATENRALVRLVGDVATMQAAGACTAAQVVQVADNAKAGETSPTTTAPADTSTSTTTTTTTTPAVAASTTTSTSSTTTTTSTSTTTTTQPIIPLPTTTTTSTTAAPSSTTTTSSPTTTTTTTTTPARAANTPPPTPNPAGIQALQGCVSSLAPAAPAATS